MPPPRRQASAPKAESKSGLVVALVFFILMTIVFAVVAYMGFEFENLQLQPIKMLRMSDENTGPPLKPFIEDAATRLKWIQSAMSTFSDAPTAADAKA